MSSHYIELAPDEFESRLAHAPIAYLPLGTLEWHGPHLPLGADGIQPLGLFEALARDVGGIILPMLFVGPDVRRQIDGRDLIGMDTCPMSTPAYPPQKFPGSAYWVNDDLFISLLDSIVEQLARAGFRIIVAHGHGPSTGKFAEQADRWQAVFGVKTMICWVQSGGLAYMGDHAALNETSITLYVRPDLVRMDRLPTDPAAWPPGVGGQHENTYREENPRHATAENGRRILQSTLEVMKRKLTEAMASLRAAGGLPAA
jgi:creatinine amidohydrolase